MEKTTRKAIHDTLEKYDYLAKKDDFIEVTEWTNGEGYDIQIGDNKLISLTRGEIDAIQYLILSLEYQK